MQENQNSEQIKVIKYCYKHKKLCCKQKNDAKANSEEIVEHFRKQKETDSIVEEMMEGKPDLYDEDVKTL